ATRPSTLCGLRRPSGKVSATARRDIRRSPDTPHSLGTALALPCRVHPEVKAGRAGDSSPGPTVEHNKCFTLQLDLMGVEDVDRPPSAGTSRAAAPRQGQYAGTIRADRCRPCGGRGNLRLFRRVVHPE